MQKYLECLKTILIDQTTSPNDEIIRLSLFRGFNKPVEVNDLILFLNKYFAKDNVKNEQVYISSHNDKWAKCFAGKPIYGIRVDPLKLEPFVARYVNAINAIGAKTCSSCDPLSF